MRTLQLSIILALFTLGIASANDGPKLQCGIRLPSVFTWIRHPIKMLRNEWNGLRMPEEVTAFDIAKYTAAKERFDAKNIFKPTCFEEKIALIESIQEKNTGELANFIQLYEAREFTKTRKIADMVIALDFDKGFSELKVERVVSRLYRIVYEDPYALNGVFKIFTKGYRGLSEDAFSRIVKEKLVSKGLIEVAKELKIVTDAKSLEELRAFIKKKEFRIAFNVAVNTGTTLTGFPFPSPPGIRLSQWLKLPDEFYVTAISEGVDKAVAKLAEEHKFIFKSEIGYNWFKKVYGTIVTGLFAWFIVEKIRQNNLVKEVLGSDDGHELHEYFSSTLEKLRGILPAIQIEKLFQAWMDDFKSENGKEPDANSAEYILVKKLIYGN